MKKYITPALTFMAYLRHLQTQHWDDVAGEFELNECPRDENGSWALSWAFPVRKTRNAVFETGFFSRAIHIDQRGLYHLSSFNTPGAIERIKEFNAPTSAQDLVFGDGAGRSKYGQSGGPMRWDEIVLAAQVPHDRSVRAVGTVDDYWEFVEEACRYYGKHLYIKMHPKNNPQDRNRYRDFEHKHGVTYGNANMSVLDHCRFLLVYCSTMAMDAFLRRKPVAQYAPGYWHETGAVTYTDWELPDDVEDTVDMGSKVADWAAWRYCANYAMPREMWFDMLRLYANTDDLFPMTDEFCYAKNITRKHP